MAPSPKQSRTARRRICEADPHKEIKAMSWDQRRNLGIVAIGVAATYACGNDEDSTQSAGTDSGATVTGSASVGGGSTGAGGTAGAAGGGAGGAVRGCMDNPDICPDGTMCCTGVPYPEDGVCQRMCDLNSDRAVKHGFEPVNEEALLERLMQLEVTRWSYDASASVQHIGPMAQDFHRAFGLGSTDRSISAVDANGVLVASIQALVRRVEQLETSRAAEAADARALRTELHLLRNQAPAPACSDVVAPEQRPGG
jgi:hypothetical protein